MGPRRTSRSPAPHPVISKGYPLSSTGQKQSATKSSVDDVVSGVPIADPICLLCKKGYLSNPFDATMIPCKHVFHSDCIVSWVRKNHCCPVCRFKINPLVDDAAIERGERGLLELRYASYYDDECEVCVKGIALGIGFVVSLQLFAYACASGFFNFW